MNAAAMQKQIDGVSQNARAKLAGAFYFMTTVMGVATVITGRLVVVSGDVAAATAGILAQEAPLRFCAAAGICAGACCIAVTALFYELFKPVDRRVSLLAAFFALVGCAIATLSDVMQFGLVAALKALQYLTEVKVDPLQDLALAFFRVLGQASNLAFAFLGLYCLLIGALIVRSTFLPRALGALTALAGVCWLTGSFIALLSAPFARLPLPFLLAGGAGQLALSVWLLVKGLNVERWNARAEGVEQHSNARSRGRLVHSLAGR